MVAARVTVVAATADGGSRAGPNVRLAAGDRASGLACMLASLLQDNLRDFRSRSFVARFTRGDVVLLASDRDIAVTLSFRPGEIVIEDGAVLGAPVLAGEWLDLAKVCSGQRSPIAAVDVERAARHTRAGNAGRGRRGSRVVSAEVVLRREP